MNIEPKFVINEHLELAHEEYLDSGVFPPENFIQDFGGYLRLKQKEINRRIHEESKQEGKIVQFIKTQLEEIKNRLCTHTDNQESWIKSYSYWLIEAFSSNWIKSQDEWTKKFLGLLLNAPLNYNYDCFKEWLLHCFFWDYEFKDMVENKSDNPDFLKWYVDFSKFWYELELLVDAYETIYPSSGLFGSFKQSKKAAIIEDRDYYVHIFDSMALQGTPIYEITSFLEEIIPDFEYTDEDIDKNRPIFFDELTDDEDEN